MTDATARSDLRLLRRLLAEARPWSGIVLLLLLIHLLLIPVALLVPVPVQMALDSVLGDEPLPAWIARFGMSAADKDRLLVVTTGLILAIALLQGGLSMGAAVLSTWVSENLVLGLRSRLFRHAQRLCLGFHDATSSADTLYRIQHDATAIEGVVVGGVLPMLQALLTVAALIVVAARLDPTLLGVALLVAPLLALVARLSRHPLRRAWHEAKRIASQVMTVLEEILTSLPLIRAFGRERPELERFAERGRAGVRAQVIAVGREGAFGFVFGSGFAVATAVLLYIGVRHVQSGRLTLGELVAVLYYLGYLYQPLSTLGSKFGEVQGALASAERAFAILDRAPEVAEHPGARALDRARGEIVFDEVEFAYRTPVAATGEPILRASLHIPAGARVGIVGQTGAGKTTLINLLPRFYDPTAGAILLDGVDLRGYRLADLRRQFSIVSQDVVLLAASVADNIAYGRAWGLVPASREEVEAAARAAGADAFIRQLPEGYETPVGERGQRLSGGQRQLVALARAFLRDAPILILDEPTSAIDVATEQQVLAGLESLTAGRTSLIISHRLSALAGCDQLLRLRDGRLERLPAAPEASPERSAPPLAALPATAEGVS